jgi:hypothetical protein
MTNNTKTPFQGFLDEHEGFAARVQIAPGRPEYAFNREELRETIEARERDTFEVVLRIGAAECGSATLSKLITGKLKTEQASGECIGLAEWYNESVGKETRCQNS